MKEEELNQDVETNELDDNNDPQPEEEGENQQLEESDEALEEQKDWFGDHQLSITVGGVLAAISLVIVLLVGLFSGVSFLTILFRMLYCGLIFFGLGFGIGWLISNYVSELAEVILPGSTNYSLGDNIDYTAGDDSEMDTGDDNEYVAESLTDTAEQQDVSSTKPEDGLSQKLRENSLPDDPKLLAEGIRTMMQRDE